MKDKRKNNKGFTLVEVLAVVVILGILSGIAVVATSKYKKKAVDESYDALAKSAYNAYQTYAMSKKKTKGFDVTITTLYDEGLIEKIKDPNKGPDCKGTVHVDSSVELSVAKTFDVYLCCSKKYHYQFGENESKIGEMNSTEISNYCK